MEDNPALHHAIHLPVNFLLGVATLPLWKALFGWYDARIILIAAFLVVLFVAPRLSRRWEDGHALMIALALNPLLAEHFAAGLSDFLLLGLLLLALWSRQRERYQLAAVLLGIAVATRQFSWLLLPIYFVAELRAAYDHADAFGVQSTRDRWMSALRLMITRLWPLPVVALALILPFVAADPRAFYADVIAFGSGSTEDAYFIGGAKTYGLSVAVLALGLVPDSRAYFPFTLLQLVVMLPILAYVLYTQWRTNTMQRMLFGYVLVLGSFLFTARFMHGNYLGFVFALMVLACFIARTPMAATQPVAAMDHQEAAQPDTTGGTLVPRSVVAWQRILAVPMHWRRTPARSAEQKR